LAFLEFYQEIPGFRSAEKFVQFAVRNEAAQKAAIINVHLV
jgi:hypothetical protein